MHNFQNYDGIFTTAAAVKYCQQYGWKINGVPQTKQKFASLDVGIFKFLDSIKFIPDSLSNIVDMCRKSGCKFELLKYFKWGNLDGERDVDMLTRKG